jgi:hypothetical protein
LSGTYDASNTAQLVVRVNNLVYGVTAGTSVTIDGSATATVAGLVLDAANGTWSLSIPRERELNPTLAGTLYTVTVMATVSLSVKPLASVVSTVSVAEPLKLALPV